MSFFRKPTPLPVQQGGTGDAYFSSGYALIGNGYSALLELTPSTSGNVMTSNGTTWTSAPPSGGGMVYPAAGIANSTGTAWGSSYSTTGANSVVVRDANQNISVNAISTGFTNVAAAGTTTTLTAASTPNFVVTGSGGQTYQLPDATTLPNGAIFTFNNNQSSGTIVVKNNSSTTIVTVQSGGFVVVVLQSNSIAAGSWDYHAQAPSNVSWSTNTFNYVGSITGATWNGTAIGIAYGGTGQTTASAGFNALSPITTTGDLIIGNGTNSATRLAIGANTYVLTSNGTTASWVAPSGGGGSQATATALGTVYALQTTGGGYPYLTAFGYNAGTNTTAPNSTAIGVDALSTNTTGDGTAVGRNTLKANTTGSQNTAVGLQAMLTNTIGYANCAFGESALITNLSGIKNSAFGFQALLNNSTGEQNVAVGWKALNSNTANCNVAVGSSALQTNTTAAYNTAVGYLAMYSNTTGDTCTGIGEESLYSNTTGTQNTALGSGALYTNSTGSYNTSLGRLALFSNTTASNNVAMGYQAGYQVTTGGNNILLGQGAGYAGFGNNLTTGSSNIILGTSSPSISSTTYEIIIGHGVNGKGGSTGVISPAGGAMYQGNNTATWAVASDQRLKKNIVTNTVGLESINAIRVCNFEYRTKDEVTDLPKQQAIDKQGVQLGAIAQELQQILPDCVKEESTGVLSVNSDNIMWHMVNAIKELSAKVIALEAKVGV